MSQPHVTATGAEPPRRPVQQMSWTEWGHAEDARRQQHRQQEAMDSGTSEAAHYPVAQHEPLIAQLSGGKPEEEDTPDIIPAPSGLLPAPATPTDAAVTDVASADESDDEVPTRTNATHMSPVGRWQGLCPQLPKPGQTRPPPGLDQAEAASQSDAMQLDDEASVIAAELTQWNIVRSLYAEYKAARARTEAARQNELIFKRKFEEAWDTKPKPGQPSQAWIRKWEPELNADV